MLKQHRRQKAALQSLIKSSRHLLGAELQCEAGDELASDVLAHKKSQHEEGRPETRSLDGPWTRQTAAPPCWRLLNSLRFET